MVHSPVRSNGWQRRPLAENRPRGNGRFSVSFFPRQAVPCKQPNDKFEGPRRIRRWLILLASSGGGMLSHRRRAQHVLPLVNGTWLPRLAPVKPCHLDDWVAGNSAHPDKIVALPDALTPYRETAYTTDRGLRKASTCLACVFPLLRKEPLESQSASCRPAADLFSLLTAMSGELLRGRLAQDYRSLELRGSRE